jgi:hypothetical protein
MIIRILGVLCFGMILAHADASFADSLRPMSDHELDGIAAGSRKNVSPSLSAVGLAQASALNLSSKPVSSSTYAGTKALVIFPNLATSHSISISSISPQ